MQINFYGSIQMAECMSRSVSFTVYIAIEIILTKVITIPDYFLYFKRFNRMVVTPIKFSTI